ncbi:transposase [Micromonospora purpureochromogenes]|uniref:transposase n=1 Tax=Micromonospora purpureochromogenes TaxID=47872 RepID=UPI0033C7AC5E
MPSGRSRRYRPRCRVDLSSGSRRRRRGRCACEARPPRPDAFDRARPQTDQADALSVGIAAYTAVRLNTAVVDEAIAALRCLTEHRDDLVRGRTQIVNRLHALLAQRIPAGLPRGLAADSAAAALRSIRPRAVLARTMRQVAVELLRELRRLDRRIAAATATLSAAVVASDTTLTDLHGIGDVTAAKILVRSGVVNSFRSESAFASYCGVAPIEVSSGDIQRHRLSRAGDRQLNYALHVMAMAQIKRATPRSGLLPAQTSRRQNPQGSHALPETAPVRRRLRHHDQRHGDLSAAGGLTREVPLNPQAHAALRSVR